LTIRLTKEEFQVVMDDGEVIERTKHYRHNYEYITIVFPYLDSFYRATYMHMADDGIYWEDTYDCDEVEQVEVLNTVWRTKL
jgi:hypothetical protein